MEETKSEEKASPNTQDSEAIDTPKWLKRLQENSWEPEILISGLSLAFIFAFPAALYNFAAYAIQEVGLHFLAGFLVLIYLSGVVNVFKIFFIVHLAMRFAWVGAVGASYAFPKGVNTDELFKAAKDYTYSSINKHILKLERLCSMAFGFPLMLALIFIPITLFLIVLIGIYKLFDLPFFGVYILFIVLLIILTVVSLMSKKSKMKENAAKSLSGTLNALYSSNLGKWKMSGYIFGIMFISVPFVIQDTKGFMSFLSDSSLDSTQEWTDLANRNTQDTITQTNNRFARFKLNKLNNQSNKYAIYLAHYEEDFKHLQPLNTHFKDTLARIDWPELTHQTDLYRVVVNDSILPIENWLTVKLPTTQQKAYETVVDLSWLPSNELNEIRIEKVLVRRLLFEKGKFRYRDRWHSIKFFN